MVPPAAAQRETGPWERKTDKTHSVRNKLAARPLPGALVHAPAARGSAPVAGRPDSAEGTGVTPARLPTPASPPRARQTQIRTHRPVRRGLTPQPPLPAEEVQPLPPAAMTPHLARSGGRGACDSSGSLRPHLHLTPRTRPSAAARARGHGGAPPAWGRGAGRGQVGATPCVPARWRRWRRRRRRAGRPQCAR